MTKSAIGLLSLVLGPLAGCRNTPPPRVQVPSETDGNPYTTYRHDDVKPLPPSATQQLREESQQPQGAVTGDSSVRVPPEPPVVSQAYFDAYDKIGRPRLMVLVDRPDAPGALVPGDFEMLERVVREALSARGQVLVVSPATINEQVDAQQLREIAAGRAEPLVDAGAKLRADILVQVRVTPSAQGGETQLSATARHTRDNQQIASAAAAVGTSPPRRQLDFAGRLLAERLVDELAAAWNRMQAPPPSPTASAPSTTAPPAARAPADPPSPTRPSTQP